MFNQIKSMLPNNPFKGKSLMDQCAAPFSSKNSTGSKAFYVAAIAGTIAARVSPYAGIGIATLTALTYLYNRYCSADESTGTESCKPQVGLISAECKLHDKVNEEILKRFAHDEKRVGDSYRNAGPIHTENEKTEQFSLMKRQSQKKDLYMQLEKNRHNTARKDLEKERKTSLATVDESDKKELESIGNRYYFPDMHCDQENFSKTMLLLDDKYKSAPKSIITHDKSKKSNTQTISTLPSNKSQKPTTSADKKQKMEIKDANDKYDWSLGHSHTDEKKAEPSKKTDLYKRDKDFDNFVVVHNDKYKRDKNFENFDGYEKASSQRGKNGLDYSNVETPVQSAYNKPQQQFTSSLNNMIMQDLSGNITEIKSFPEETLTATLVPTHDHSELRAAPQYLASQENIADLTENFIDIPSKNMKEQKVLSTETPKLALASYNVTDKPVTYKEELNLMLDEDFSFNPHPKEPADEYDNEMEFDDFDVTTEEIVSSNKKRAQLNKTNAKEVSKAAKEARKFIFEKREEANKNRKKAYNEQKTARQQHYLKQKQLSEQTNTHDLQDEYPSFKDEIPAKAKTTSSEPEYEYETDSNNHKERLDSLNKQKQSLRKELENLWNLKEKVKSSIAPANEQMVELNLLNKKEEGNINAYMLAINAEIDNIKNNISLIQENIEDQEYVYSQYEDHKKKEEVNNKSIETDFLTFGENKYQEIMSLRETLDSEKSKLDEANKHLNIKKQEANNYITRNKTTSNLMLASIIETEEEIIEINDKIKNIESDIGKIDKEAISLKELYSI